MDVVITGERLAWLAANARAVSDTEHDVRRCAKLVAGGPAGSSTLEATATDLRALGVFTVPVHVAAAGACMAPADLIAAFARSVAKRGDVRLWLDGAMLCMQSKQRIVRVATLPLDRFAELPGVPDASWHPLPPGVLSRMLRFAKHAAGDVAVRPHLAGLRIEAVDGILSVVSLDGARAAFASQPTDARDFATTLPMRVVAEVMAAFVDDDESACEIAECARDVWLRRPDGALVLAAKKLQDGFPERWRDLLEDRGDTPHTAIVDRAELAEAVKGISGVEGRDDTRAATLAWGEDTLTITAEGTALHGGSDVVALARLVSGPEPATQCVSLRYVAQALAAFADVPTVVLRAGGPTAPLWITGRDDGPAYRRCLIMPMQRPA